MRQNLYSENFKTQKKEAKGDSGGGAILGLTKN